MKTILYFLIKRWKRRAFVCHPPRPPLPPRFFFLKHQVIILRGEEAAPLSWPLISKDNGISSNRVERPWWLLCWLNCGRGWIMGDWLGLIDLFLQVMPHSTLGCGAPTHIIASHKSSGLEGLQGSLPPNCWWTIDFCLPVASATASASRLLAVPDPGGLSTSSPTAKHLAELRRGAWCLAMLSMLQDLAPRARFGQMGECVGGGVGKRGWAF